MEGRLRPRFDEFAQSEEARGILADFGLGENDFYVLLVDNEYADDAKRFIDGGGLSMFDSFQINRIGSACRTYFASDKYPGVESDPEAEVAIKKAMAGVNLCLVIVGCVNEVYDRKQEELELAECRRPRKPVAPKVDLAAGWLRAQRRGNEKRFEATMGIKRD